MALPEQGAPMAAPQEQNPEDAVVDQIGKLMEQLSPEKAAEVIAQLSQMLGGGGDDDEPVALGTSSPEGGARGKPVGMGM